MIKTRLNNKKGFTLFEVLAAVAFMAFAVPALMLLLISQTDSAAALRNKTVAIWVAENTLTQLRLERRLSGDMLRRIDEKTVTMAGAEWQVVTEPEETEFGALLRYQARVSLAEKPENTLTTLSTFVH